MKNESVVDANDIFSDRHIGPNLSDISDMLKLLNCSSLEDLCNKTIPSNIRIQHENTPTLGSLSESEALRDLKQSAEKNLIFKSWIGMGYANCLVPAVIQRNILENPSWYTQYTPYQPEISQGRLESLLNFQTIVCELTGFEVANASLLDESTAAAEAMMLCYAEAGKTSEGVFFISQLCHPQTIDVVLGRAQAFGIKTIVGDHKTFDFSLPVFGALLQYPASDGSVYDYHQFIETLHKHQGLVVLACDLLSLTLIRSPKELGADIAVGNTQRLGVPLGYGGPHAAFFATRDEFKRRVPGRIVGVSKDTMGNKAFRLTLQTREQHIRREKATSNICTAQALLANMAAMYCVYHGPEGLKKIANKVHFFASLLKIAAQKCALKASEESFFDTVRIEFDRPIAQEVQKRAWEFKTNIRVLNDHSVTIAFDETTTFSDVADVLKILTFKDTLSFDLETLAQNLKPGFKFQSKNHQRASAYLGQDVFNLYHSETELLRYMKRLEQKDLSLTHSMIPLGSCTMKLNATSELMPLSWPLFSQIHPFVPAFQAIGYKEILTHLEKLLAQLTGFDAVSLQPNSGAQGEYAGLLVIRAYQQSQGQGHRHVCLIPSSAHGTNPASAALANLKVVVVDCDKNGNIDLEDLRAKAREYKDSLSAFMITYPSTHGVFEATMREVCQIIHENGGQVYMDGANLNAQIGLCRPGDYGPDLCHLNLHKTFSIPHGGGGPGAGPIAVKSHLRDFLPGHVMDPEVGGRKKIRAISSSPYGSASILLISWSYISMMGHAGLKKATQVAILNANYLAKKLDGHYEVLYKGDSGFVAHECIIDVRPLKKTSGVEVSDIAKRLMDYGFHAPTVSFPVAGTLMIEPTESENKAEIDRFCEAMIAIKKEILEISAASGDKNNNILKNAPHTVEVLTASEWTKPYTREKAAFPLPWVKERKFWPSVSRIDEAYGDRNFMCTCS